MTRHWPALIAALAVAATAPAHAQDRPPPSAWADPQVSGGPPAAGAPFVPPPGAYPMPAPMPGPVPPLPPGAYPMPMPPSGMPAPGYTYQYGATGAPCGCGGPAYTFVWVPVQIRTNYVYSAAIERVREVPEEHVVYREAVETRTMPVRGKVKYVKSSRPAKLTKGKTIRAAK